MTKINSSDSWKVIREEFSNEILLSIVTVTKNDRNGLKNTLDSLKRLSDLRIELLIVSGDSTNSTDNLGLEFGHISIINNQNSGIYHAMNIGLQQARGEYIWFLNGGDESLIKSISWLSSESHDCRAEVYLCDYVVTLNGKSQLRQSRSSEYIWHGLPTSHQAIFYARAVLKTMRYSNEYVITGDYDLTARLYMNKAKFRKVNIVVAKFDMNGVSGKSLLKLVGEVRRIQKKVLKSSFSRRTVSTLKHLFSGLFRKLQRFIG